MIECLKITMPGIQTLCREKVCKNLMLRFEKEASKSCSIPAIELNFVNRLDVRKNLL
jgi:hypothetical protein